VWNKQIVTVFLLRMNIITETTRVDTIEILQLKLYAQ